MSSSDADAIRWQQRLESFGNVLGQLEAACAQENCSVLERAGLIRMFGFSFELSWKTLKDRLFYEGFNVKSPREVIRKGFEAEYLTENDTEVFLDALGKRNLLSHTYEEEAALEAESLIRDQYCPLLRRICDTLERKRSS